MAKRIVICCDGTWSQPDQPNPTNVTKIALAIAPRDSSGTTQCVYYDKGVGTRRFDRLLGGAFGWGLSRHIQDAYRYLIETYDPGDELYFFGFSRGAYTARSTVGLLRNSGLLRREFIPKLPEAFALYRRRDSASHPDAVESELFRKSYSYEPRVKFIGVWDTVGALGLPVGGLLGFLNHRWAFHDVQLSRCVDNAFQALAIDEKRRHFRPTLWEQHKEARGQVLEQVWFAGSHSNGGGGYSFTGLSDITILWMAGKAARCGLAFDRPRLAALDIGNPQSWDRYAYVQNNPLALVDPLGLDDCLGGEHANCVSDWYVRRHETFTSLFRRRA